LPVRLELADIRRLVDTGGVDRDPPPSTEPGTAGVIAPPPLVYLGGLAAGFALSSALPATPLRPALRWPVGGGLLAIGGTLMGSFVRAFARAGTPVSPVQCLHDAGDDRSISGLAQPCISRDGAGLHGDRGQH
jgi:hypothetical protein